MLDIELEEQLVKKLGGKFKLTSLVQKRMVELHRPGARTLVKTDHIQNKKDLLRIAVEEVLQDKIQLAPREEVGYSLEEERILLERAKVSTANVSEDDAPAGAEIYGSDIKKIKEQRIKELAELLNPNKK
jgi:DNA-directed RNA polymerase subunit omega